MTITQLMTIIIRMKRKFSFFQLSALAILLTWLAGIRFINFFDRFSKTIQSLKNVVDCNFNYVEVVLFEVLLDIIKELVSFFYLRLDSIYLLLRIAIFRSVFSKVLVVLVKVDIVIFFLEAIALRFFFVTHFTTISWFFRFFSLLL